MKVAFLNENPTSFWWVEDSTEANEGEAFTSREFVDQAIASAADYRVERLSSGKALQFIVAAVYILAKKIDGPISEQEQAQLDALKAMAAKSMAIRAHAKALAEQFAGGQSVNLNEGWPQ